MTENQKKVLKVIKQAAPWKKVAERDVIFFARHLIDYGQKPKTFIKAIGKDVGPLGDASIENNLYASVSSIQRINEYLKELIETKGTKEILKIKERCVKAAEELHGFLRGSDFSDLKGDLLKFKDLYSHLTPFLLMVVFSDKMLSKEVEKLIVKKLGHLDEEYFGNVSYISEFNTSTEEIINLLKISIQAKDNNWSIDDPKLLDLVNEHEIKYGWLGARGQFEPDWTAQDFLERIQNYLSKYPQEELNNIFEARDKAEDLTKKFIDEYNLTQSEKDLIDISKQFVYLRTYRTEMIYGSHSLVRPLMNKIADKLNINHCDILYLTVDEILDLLDNKEFDYAAAIAERKKGFYIIQYGDDLDFFAGDDMKAVDGLGIFEEHKNVDQTLNEIKGQIAWKGKVKGRARIVRYEDDIKSVQEGDILVAVMTFPNFVPAMERAAAFVTDEGGILCHAAIVSREMHKPCVIGTKLATKVFQDGDIIEVDANKGIVKKL